MKLKKALLLVVSALLLMSITVVGTLAYLTSTDTVTNTFTVGKVVITLDEAKVKTDGTYETNVNNRVDANTYKLFPGRTYIKDPTVHVDTTSENCWLFVKVTNDIVAIEAADVADDPATAEVNEKKDVKIATQMATKGWTLVAGETDVYAYKAICKAGDNVVVFDNFTVAGTVTDLTNYANANVTIVAYAVQADGFASAAAAWTAAKSELVK